MANYIPDEKVTEVRTRADIVEIVSESVRLKKTGKNYLGLCPFHTEKTPSFTVSPDKQIFHCFGCGEGGNAFGFLMKLNGFSFPEAVRQIARRYGIKIPRRPLTLEQQKRINRREQVLAVNRKALKYYQHSLKNTPAGQKALTYLGRRGMNEEILETFSLGYAPEGWRNLYDHLKRAGFSDRLCQTAGLIIPNKERAGYYDRFRNRIIFPIIDLGEQVVGFGGRVLGDDEPKYLNSPESPVYNKRRILYGLNRTRQACRRRDEVHIVEGYFDLLTLYQHGIENSAATLGTALTEEHIRVIKGTAERTILTFDADEGGMKAALRSCHLFIKAGVEARVLVLPAGQDPDSYVRQNGPEALTQAAEHAPGIIGYIVESAIRRFGLSVEGRIRIIDQLQPLLTKIDDPVARSLYIGELADRIDVDEGAIQEKLRLTVPNRPARTLLPKSEQIATKQRKAVAHGRSYKLERLIVAMLLQYPQMIAEVAQRDIVDHFVDTRLREIGRLVIECGRKGSLHIPAVIESAANSELKQMIASLAMGSNEEWSPKGCRQLLDQYRQISAKGGKQTLAKIKAAEAAGDYDTVARLQRQWASNKQLKAGIKI